MYCMCVYMYIHVCVWIGALETFYISLLFFLVRLRVGAILKFQ